MSLFAQHLCSIRMQIVHSFLYLEAISNISGIFRTRFWQCHCCCCTGPANIPHAGGFLQQHAACSREQYGNSTWTILCLVPRRYVLFYGLCGLCVGRVDQFDRMTIPCTQTHDQNKTKIDRTFSLNKKAISERFLIKKRWIILRF